jgi:opacity protein-like surface antigen
MKGKIMYNTASTSLGALVAVASVVAVPALAQETSSGESWWHPRADHSMDGTYISGRGGWSNVDDHNYTTGVGSVETKLDGGYLAGGAVGMRKGPWRAEIEGLYSESDVKSHTVSGVTTANADGSTSMSAAMANVYLDVANIKGFRPYVGGGAGDIGLAAIGDTKVQIGQAAAQGLDLDRPAPAGQGVDPVFNMAFIAAKTHAVFLSA